MIIAGRCSARACSWEAEEEERAGSKAAPSYARLTRSAANSAAAVSTNASVLASMMSALLKLVVEACAHLASRVKLSVAFE